MKSPAAAAALALMLLALPCSPAFAQSGPPTPAEADRLFDQAVALYRSEEYVKAVPLLETAVSINAALGRGRLAELGSCRKILGVCLIGADRDAEGEQQMALALEIFSGLDDAEEMLDVLSFLGLTEYYSARYPQASSRFSQGLALARARGIEGQVPAMLNNLGMVLAAQASYAEAIASYRAALAEHERRGDRANAAATLGNIAGIYLSWGRYPDAEREYGRALAQFKALGDGTSVINTLTNLGMTASARGAYDEARAHLEAAVRDARSARLPSSEAWALASLGSVLYATGSYDKAVTAYFRALAIFQDTDMRLYELSTITGLAAVFQAWGRNDRALELYSAALAAAREIGAPDQVLANLRLIGAIHQAEGRYAEAVASYAQALEIAESTGREGDRVQLLDALGAAHFQWRRDEEAVRYYERALALGRSLGKQDEIARVLIHLGGARQVAGKFADARSLYDQALASCRAAGMRSEEAVVLNNLGTLALARGTVDEAVAFLRSSVQIKEQLRLTASGTARRDFLASWISSYRKLIEAHHLAGSAAAAFDAAEMVKARTLAEQMQRGSGGGGASRLDAASLQKSLPAGSAVVSFANADWEYPVGICLTRTRAFVVRLAQDPPPALAAAVLGPEDRKAGALQEAQGRGYLLVDDGEEGRTGFEPLVQAYRWLLARPRLTAEQAARRSELGRFLYSALLGPFEGQLEAVDDILIIPDGSLGTLPFEALVRPDGRWVAERWNLTYLPSAQVRSLLESRGSSRAPRPLLALGGVSYEARPAAELPRVSPRQLTALRAEAGRLLEQGKPAREIYEDLGFASWQPLPGTLAEVTAIGRAVPGSVVLTGAEASEQKLKGLARADELAQYRVLHFATHGVLVPGVPELSAVVLAEAGTGGQPDDGYLTSTEVARLRLDADFVDLSACETGLGKVYQGEGVVGLTQAFLVAGARSMAVSLWQVADESTREFMVGVYRLVQERGIPYARAMTEMRRQFIRAGRWREPFYWAPFVYYGR